MFRGNHSASVDQKGRFRIPSAFLDNLREQYGDELFVTSLDGDSLRIYPLNIWQKLERKLHKLPAMHPSRLKLMARFTYFGADCKLDKAGRLLIPALIRERAKLTAEVAVLGYVDYLEVWNKTVYEEALVANPLTEEDLIALSDLGI
jgi:MraZ protein